MLNLRYITYNLAYIYRHTRYNIYIITCNHVLHIYSISHTLALVGSNYDLIHSICNVVMNKRKCCIIKEAFVVDYFLFVCGELRVFCSVLYELEFETSLVVCINGLTSQIKC